MELQGLVEQLQAFSRAPHLPEGLGQRRDELLRGGDIEVTHRVTEEELDQSLPFLKVGCFTGHARWSGGNVCTPFNFADRSRLAEANHGLACASPFESRGSTQIAWWCTHARKKEEGRNRE